MSAGQKMYLSGGHPDPAGLSGALSGQFLLSPALTHDCEVEEGRRGCHLAAGTVVGLPRQTGNGSLHSHPLWTKLLPSRYLKLVT